MEDRRTDPGVLDSIGQHDILIAVVGNAGVGKSTFINEAVTEDLLPIGQASEIDNEVQYVACSRPELYQGQRIIFLDIPAFSPESDEQTIQNNLRYWLRVVIAKRLNISGILYLHRMTETEFSGASLRHLTSLMTLFEESNQNPIGVMLVLTMQAHLGLLTRLQRKKEIQEKWNTLFPLGASRSMRFKKSSCSAWEIVIDLTTYSNALAKRSNPLRSIVSRTRPITSIDTQPAATGSEESLKRRLALLGLSNMESLPGPLLSTHTIDSLRPSFVPERQKAMPEKANGPEVNAENPKPVSSPLTNDTSTNGPKQARATSQLIKNVDEEDPVVLPHSISKPSTAQLSKNPSIPRPSAWSRGPPQSSNSPSHSQLPTPTTPTVQTHSRRRRAFSGVSIKDGGSVSRDNVPASEQGAAMTFGSIDDISASISLSPAVAPPTKSDSVESFDTIEADSHVNEKSNGPMSNYQQSSPGTPNRRSVRLETPEQRNQRLAEEERARTENCEEPKKKKKKKKKKVPEHEQKEFEEKERTEGEELKRKEEKEKERIRKEEEEKERIRKEAEAIDVAPPELVDREVRGLLNELTIERFDPVSDQIIKWANKSKDEKDGRTLIQVIRLVLEKATDEASWSEMYARLCRKMVEQISNEVQDDWIRTPEGKPIAGGQLFRRYLLNKCQEDFERGWAADKVTIGVTKAATGGGDKEVMLHPEEHHTTQKAKRRGLGLVKLIGELFKLQMLTERIMHECVKKLLGDVNSPEEEEIEGLCQLLTTVGSLLDTQKARAHVDVYFMRMKELAKSSKVGPRTQSMLQDTIKLRERGWVTGNRTTREEEHLRWQINISPGGSQDGGNAAWHPSKAVGLSNFGKIGRKAGPPTMFGPGSVFAGGKAVNRRESLSQTGSSSNMFSMLQGAESEADRASEAQPTRKRLALLPRSKPVEQAETQKQESSENEETFTSAATAEMSDEAADKKIKEDSKEFFGVRNLDEAEVYFTALPAQHHYKLVDKLVSTAVESKEGDALLVSDLFARAVSKRLCGPASFEEGFTPVAEIIDDIAIDAPKALTLFATMIKGAGFDEERRSRLASKSMDGGKLLVLLS